MTEEEKRALAHQIMEQESARLRSRAHALNDQNQQRLNDSLQRTAKQRQVLSSLARNGITWDQLREAYHSAFKAGHDAMLTFKLSFFYAEAAIAFHERFSSSPESTATFINQMVDIAEEYPDRAAIMKQCLAETGIDTSAFDEAATFTPGRASMTMTTATRKDREAVERMRRTGITQKDLEYEKRIGYTNGWHTGAGMSVCYACAAISLHRFHGCGKDEIETFLERVVELEDEEISAHDIIERAIRETDVEVSEIAAGGKEIQLL